MKAYLYDNNGFYYAETALQENPLRPGTFFEQPHAVTIKPITVSENEVPYWNGNDWEKKPNYSGRVYYSKKGLQEKYFEIGESFDDNYTDIKPINFDHNKEELMFENGGWQIFNKVFFNKETKMEVIISKKDINEDFVSKHVKIKPENNQDFQFLEWNEAEQKWLVNQIKKEETLFKNRQIMIKQLLLETDYIELPTFQERKTAEEYQAYLSYRANLRLAYHDKNIEMPQKPSFD